MNKNTLIAAAIVLFWAGFVCSISFMEAWLKFRAPGVTLPVGLSIGKKVFTALNRMEWAFFALTVVLIFIKPAHLNSLLLTATVLLLIIMTLQTFVFLPELNERAQRIINGETLQRSSVHLYFGIAEVLKVSVLISTGMFLILKR